jgi:ATP phosphoribosyltransferase regulatory subunit
MRDLLPAEAEDQRRLASAVLSAFELNGYQQVSVPAFEYADVLERGLGTVDPCTMLRFVEPESGEVVALRPDMTPQVARLIATRLRDRCVPARLSYRGSVLRRQHERARHEQQAQQAGIELVGAAGTEADFEVLSVCVAAVRATGLDDFVIDLGHGGIAPLLLQEVGTQHRAGLLEALSLKDRAELHRRGQVAGLSDEVLAPLAALLTLQGGLEVFEAARAALEGTVAWQAVLELSSLAERVAGSNMASRLVIDLGETRAAAYYTGPTFQILAEGPGRPIASGGRYDSLYEQFGVRRPAAGCAIQLDHLRWALGKALGPGKARVVVVSVDASSKACVLTEKALQSLRQGGVACVLVSGDAAERYARDWGYSHIGSVTSEGDLRLAQVEPEGLLELGQKSLQGLAEVIRR